MGYKALIVDDNTVNATVISGLLKKFDVDSEACLSGAEAVARSDLNEFHIVFTDYMMPGMDGIEIGRRLREFSQSQGRELPVILCTANVGAAGLAADVEAGISYILKKPVKLQELEQILQRYVNKGLSLDNSHTEDLLSSKLDIPGLDTSFAIRQAGDERIYLNILNEFHKAIKSTSGRIRKYEQENDTKGYRIEVHGLKSASRLVGAMELANLCEFLENETKSRKPLELKKQTEYLLRIYESFLEKLSPFVEKEEQQKEISDVR